MALRKDLRLNSPDPTVVVDAAGNIRVPADYLTSYQFLGSWAVAADQGTGSKEIHTVYASPGVIAGYRKDGRFPDGSVLVKEVFETATEAMTTGTVSHGQTLKGWFVMVRDSSDAHRGNRLWGDGWGWSWFDAGDPRKTTSTDYKVDCQACHLPAQATAVAGNDCGSLCSELLRLDLSVPPTPPAGQSRLGSVLGGDPAGFPNGRRPNDDVTDIAIRVVGGADYIAIKAGDGVNFLDGAPGAGLPQGPGNLLGTTATGMAGEFPFLPTPYPGRS